MIPAPPADWQTLWEQHALEERARLENVPVHELLEAVRLGRCGDYFAIWGAISSRATLAEAGWILLGVLEREPDDLLRYHCAQGLLSMLGMPGLRAADLCRESPGCGSALETLRAELLRRIGAPGESGTDP